MHVNSRGRFAKVAVGAALLLGSSQLVMSAIGDWPQWRGPKRDNISTETGLLKDWPKEGPPLAWEIKGLGAGYSSVSIAGGKIFTMGSFPNNPPAPVPEVKLDKKGNKIPPPIDQSTSVIALDLTGKTLWSTKIGPTGEGGGYVGPRCTPTYDDGHVYAVSDPGDLVCLAADDGKEVWRINFRTDLKGNMPGWGYAESPTIDGDKLICTPGGKEGAVAALDKKTGKVIWRSKEYTDGATHASLVPCEIGGAHQYVVLGRGNVAGIGADGALLWQIERKAPSPAVIPTPIVKDNLVFATSGYGIGGNLFKIEGSSTALKAQEVYGKNKDMVVKHGGVVLVNDAIYGATERGMVECISIKDGSLLWKDRSVGQGSIAYADGRLYVRSEGSGDIGLIEASPESYKEHGILKQPDRSRKSAWAHPVIAGAKLYVRDQDILLCYDIKGK